MPSTFVSDPVRAFGIAAPLSPLIGRRILATNPAIPTNHLPTGVNVGRLNIHYSGAGTISGITFINNVPAARMVRLFDKTTGALIAQQWSAADGSYTFTHLDPQREYFAIAHDHLRVFNAVVSDMLTAQ